MHLTKFRNGARAPENVYIVYSVPAQETAKYRAKFDWPPVSDVAAVTLAKPRNPLKLAGVLQTTRPISAAGGLKFTILWGHVEKVLMLNKIFPIVDTYLSCKDTARQSYAMVPRRRICGNFLRPVFQRTMCSTMSDLHSKFALRPHHVWKYGRQSNVRRLRLGEERRKKNKVECGPMPNVMAALPNLGGTLGSTPQSLAHAHYQSTVQ